MIYRCKKEIDIKMSQVKYLFRRVLKYEGKLYVDLGKDQETGCYPLVVDIGSILTKARSILQYAYKESIHRNMKDKYDSYVRHTKIFNLFKKVRDEDIHNHNIDFHITLTGNNSLEKNSKGYREMEMDISLCVKALIDDELIEKLIDERNYKLLEIALNGGGLKESIDFEGNSDIFKLIRNYIEEIDKFVAYGVKEGFIT